MSDKVRDNLKLPIEQLCWCCNPDWLNFSSTKEVEPVHGVVGQEDAIEALRFGLEFAASDQNIYVRGLSGTGRMTLVRQLLEDAEPQGQPASDRVYVHNFQQTDRPRLLTLPRGSGRHFQARMEQLVEFVVEQLGPALSSDNIRTQRAAINDQVQHDLREFGKPFEDELKTNNLVLVPVQIGKVVQPTIMPLVDGEPMPLDQLEAKKEGGVTPEQLAEIRKMISHFVRKFEDVSQKILEIQLRHREALRDLFESEARRILEAQISQIETEFPQDEVNQFLKDVVDDLVDQRLGTLSEDRSFVRLYRVNLVLGHDFDDRRPIIMETSPTLQNLLGNIDREVMGGGAFLSDHLMIQPGSLLLADGGYLVLQARDVLSEPASWKILMRTLRTGKLEIVPSEFTTFWSGSVLKPEPIDINVKVILIGEPGLYNTLDAYDPDFSDLFKVLADFETTISRDEIGVRYYAGVIAHIARDEALPPFDRGAVAALVEHGARIAGRRDRLTARFGRLADVAREAAYLARKRDASIITSLEVSDAIGRGRRRADLPARQFRKMVAEGILRIQTTGTQVGQINGLAVIHAGPLTYGFPTRITATIGPGTAGTVNIEREAELSGSIHTKGFYILGGLLRHLLRTEHPLAFSASIAFEQSYGGIDGDSASGAEMCCLLSALTDVPLRQDLAMTGAIDQLGNIQPIGAVTEKVEGFFATCKDVGLSGAQGVIIPGINARDLMIGAEVLEACEAGRFHIYAVDTIHEALEVLTGFEAGQADDGGMYPKDTLLYRAEERAFAFWKMAAGKNGEEE